MSEFIEVKIPLGSQLIYKVDDLMKRRPNDVIQTTNIILRNTNSWREIITEYAYNKLQGSEKEKFTVYARYYINKDILRK
jgi:hypothetical protein